MHGSLTPGFILLLLPVPLEVEAVRSVGCSDANEGEPEVGGFHGLAERLTLRASTGVERNPP